MKRQKTALLIIGLSLLVGTAGYTFLHKIFSNHNTSITISENKEQLNISADFPKEKSKRLQDFIRTKLKLEDLQDLSYLEIKDYTTPDNQMNFYIHSKPGYLELSMKKEANDKDAYARMKEVGEELKTVLAK
jgi:hypothetical protein